MKSGDMSDAERAEFTAWYQQHPSHGSAYESEYENWEFASAIKQAFRPNNKTTPITDPQSYQELKQRISINKGWMRFAAAFTMIAFLGLYSWSDDLMILARAVVISAAGEQKQFSLPDGSIAMLNTSSALAISFSQNEQRVELLKGEVFFKVTPDKTRPFRVVTGGGLAEAVGTAYAVRKDDDVITVTVTEGGVSVYPAKNIDIKVEQDMQPVLGAGLQGRYENGDISRTVQEVDVESSLAWRSGKTVFDSTPLSKAISELDRYYPGWIIVTKHIDKATRISGIFPVQKAFSAVRAIALSNGLSVTETPGGILLLLY